MGTEINTKLPPHPPRCRPFPQETVRWRSFQERVKQLCKTHLASPVCTRCAERTPALSSAVLGEEPQEWLSTPVFVAFFVDKSKGDFWALCATRASQSRSGKAPAHKVSSGRRHCHTQCHHAWDLSVENAELVDCNRNFCFVFQPLAT